MASIAVSNFSDRWLKVPVLTVVEVVIEDTFTSISMFALRQKPSLFIKGSLRRQVLDSLASSITASPAKIIDTASTGNR